MSRSHNVIWTLSLALHIALYGSRKSYKLLNNFKNVPFFFVPPTMSWTYTCTPILFLLTTEIERINYTHANLNDFSKNKRLSYRFIFLKQEEPHFHLIFDKYYHMEVWTQNHTCYGLTIWHIWATFTKWQNFKSLSFLLKFRSKIAEKKFFPSDRFRKMKLQLNYELFTELSCWTNWNVG